MSGFLQPLPDTARAQRLGGRAIPEDKIARSWEICTVLFPEQQRSWAVHANSPLVFSTVWATMSLFRTSAHVPQRLLALATFATMVYCRSSNWFAGPEREALAEEGFTPEQCAALLAQTYSAKLAEPMPVALFDRKENLVMALAYHLVWAAGHKAADGGTSERADKVRGKVRDTVGSEFSPLQITELTWRVSMCLALISTNDFLIGDVHSAAPTGRPRSGSSSEEVVLDPQARFRANSVSSSSNSPAASPAGSPQPPQMMGSPQLGRAAGRGSARRGSMPTGLNSPARGRGGAIAVNPYDNK
jgi:hypothetical protein